MKNKKKAKKASPKKEVKRPSHKKPRVKKYVEARIPSLPPVPTATVDIVKVCAKHPDATKTPCIDCMKEPTQITIEVPEGKTTKDFTDLVLSAAEQLKVVADKALKLNEMDSAERQKLQRYAGNSLYKEPGVGSIQRYFATIQNMIPGSPEWMELRQKFVNMLNEELPKNASWKKELIKEGWRKGRIQSVYVGPEYNAPKKARKGFFGWLSGIFK